MRKSRKNDGFSLTEVLLSVGILSVGMIFIAGVFPVGIHFTTIAAERTIAAIVADEAFAKIKIYAIGDLNKKLPGDNDIDLSKLAVDKLRDFNDKDIFPAVKDADSSEFTYPSDPNINISRKQYCWSALCRRVGAEPTTRLVQVTVFVSRKTSPNLKYYGPKDSSGEVDWLDPDKVAWPVPVKVEVSRGNENDELEIDNFFERPFINDGYTIVDDETGDIYRVLERYRHPNEHIILLDRDWEGLNEVWVVPPPVNGSRYPCIAIYQKVIRF